MALFKIYRGNETNLPSEMNDGWAYFCTDTGNFYIDFKNSSGALYRTHINSEYAYKLRYLDGGATVEVDPAELVGIVNNKVDKVSGKGLSTNDYTTTEKEKLAGIESGATKTTVDATLLDNSTNPVQNKVIKQKIDEIETELDNKSENHDHPYLSSDTAYAGSDSIGGSALYAQKLNITRITSNLLTSIAVNLPIRTEAIYFGGSDAVSYGCPTTYSIVNIKKGDNHRTILDCYNLNTGDHYINGNMDARVTTGWTGWVLQPNGSHTHEVSDITDLTATATELNILDGVTATTSELNYLDGVTSNIQEQLDSKSIVKIVRWN